MCPVCPSRVCAGIQIIFYIIFGNNMIAFAFLLSCLFSSAKTASVFAYLLVFATGLIGYLLLSQLIVSGAWYVILLELIPSFALFRCGALQHAAAQMHGGCA